MGYILKKIGLIHQLFKLEDLLIGATFVFIAACFANEGLPRTNLLPLSIAILFCMLGLASINSLNQVFDVEMDRINKPRRPIPSKELSKNQVLWISIILSACAGLCAIYLGLAYIIIAFVGLAIGLMYSLPRLYVKKLPALSSAVISIGYGILMFFVGWAVYRPLSSIPIWLIFFLYLHEVFIILCKDFADLEGDRKAGIKTIPIIFGKKKGALLCFCLYLIPFIFMSLMEIFGYVNIDILGLALTGITFGVLVFAFCGFEEKRYNYLGYSFYVIGTILVRLVLFFAYIQIN
jgi:geranylgeranylglycerol-phosphate geranylgeranyltransferase